jgi:hypothetical protein
MNGGTFRGPRACRARVILSLRHKRTTTEALPRHGLASLVSEGMLLSSGWRRLDFGAVVSGRNHAGATFFGRSSAIFGGHPSLEQAGCRTSTAPSALDPSIKPEGGP